MSLSTRLLMGFGWMFLGSQEDRLARQNKTGEASLFVKGLMHFRLLYILLLPGLAVGSLAIDGKRTSFLFITAAALMYLIRAHSTFSFPVSFKAAIISAFAVPLQLAMGAIISGDSIMIYFVEDFFIEATGLFVGLGAAAIYRRHKFAWLTCIFLLMLEAANWHAFGRQLLYRDGWGLEWAVFHITALVTAVYVNMRATAAKPADNDRYYIRPEKGFDPVAVITTAVIMGIVTIAASELVSDHIRSKQKVGFYSGLTKESVLSAANKGILDDVRSFFADDLSEPLGIAELLKQPGFLNVERLTLLSIKDDGVKVLAQGVLPHLEELHLRGQITYKSLSYLFNNNNLPSLEKLSLTRSRIDFKTIRALVNSPLLYQLEHLDLSENKIGDAGVRELLSVDWPNLRSLELVKNPISFKGKKKLKESSLGKKLSFLNIK